MSLSETPTVNDAGVGLVMPEVVVKRVLELGLAALRNNPAPLEQIFKTYTDGPMAPAYGAGYISKIATWLQQTRIPVLYGYGENVEKCPSFSVHLAPEQEDETKSAMGDTMGDSEQGRVGVGAFRVTLDIGCHGDRTGDYVIWMYYLANYLLFKSKPAMEALGLQLITFSADPFKRVPSYASEVVYSRWINMQCTVINTWHQMKYAGEFDTVTTHESYENLMGVEVET